MRKPLIKLSLIIFAGMLVFLAFSCSNEKEYLFNGKNLDGWTVFVSDSTVNPEDFFYVNEGGIETIGVPNGYLRTKKEYSDYHLHVEWRYPENPTNSGIFLHTTGPDIWTVNHFQGQLNESNEKQAGEWNSYDISCKGSTIELRVNGLLQNVAANCSQSFGNIGLQAEGSKIQFRNLWLEKK
jgi:hypothetical protein